MVSATPYTVSSRRPRDIVCSVDFDDSDIIRINSPSGLTSGLRRAEHIVLRLMLSDAITLWTVSNVRTHVSYEHEALDAFEVYRRELDAHFGKDVAW